MVTFGLADTKFTRRRFISVAGFGAALAAVDTSGFLAAPLVRDGDDLTVTLVDPDSQLRLVFTFIDLDHDTDTDQLISTGSGNPLVRIELPPQHTAEAPVLSGTVPGTAPIDHRNAGPSRLVFDVTPPIDLTVDALLNLAVFSLRTTTATGDPDDDTTMIELPADLRLSPGSDVVVTSDTGPTSAAGVSQLHRLIFDAVGSIEVTPVFNASDTDPSTLQVPEASVRDDIVTGAAAGVPAVAQYLRLSNQGAWAALDGDWPDVSWSQRVQNGRDQFAQVAQRGTVLPFGFAASWTRTNTRVWIADSSGSLVSILANEEHFAVAGDQVREFPGPFSPFEGRDLPFATVTVGDVDNVLASKGQIVWEDADGVEQSIEVDDAWFVLLRAPGLIWDGYLERLSYSAPDAAGNEPFTGSLVAVFVTDEAMRTPSVRDALADFYASDAGESARRLLSRPTDLQWAEPADPGELKSTLPTSRINIEVVSVDGVSDAALDDAGPLRMPPIETSAVV